MGLGGPAAAGVSAASRAAAVVTRAREPFFVAVSLGGGAPPLPPVRSPAPPRLGRLRRCGRAARDRGRSARFPGASSRQRSARGGSPRPARRGPMAAEDARLPPLDAQVGTVLAALEAARHGRPHDRRPGRRRQRAGRRPRRGRLAPTSSSRRRCACRWWWRDRALAAPGSPRGRPRRARRRLPDAAGDVRASGRGPGPRRPEPGAGARRSEARRAHRRLLRRRPHRRPDRTEPAHRALSLHGMAGRERRAVRPRRRSARADQPRRRPEHAATVAELRRLLAAREKAGPARPRPSPPPLPGAASTW